MSEMVERVARTIRDDVMGKQGKQSQTWETISERVRNDWRQTARAAIAMMREPTDGMKRVRYEYYPTADPLSRPDNRTALWQAMIDAALAEES